MNTTDNKSKKCTAYPHLELYVAINLLLFFVVIGTYCFLTIEKSHILQVINIVLSVILSAICVFVFIFTTFSGWNSVVVFDEQKICQRRFGKVIEWRWDDISEITCRTKMPLLLRGYYLSPLFKLKCNSHDKVLVFALNPRLNKYFTELCPNEAVNRRFVELISQCDYDYPQKYNNKKVIEAKCNNVNVKAIISCLAYNTIFFLIVVIGAILYIREIFVGVIVCLSLAAILLLSELVLFIATYVRKNRK